MLADQLAQTALFAADLIATLEYRAETEKRFRAAHREPYLAQVRHGGLVQILGAVGNVDHRDAVAGGEAGELDRTRQCAGLALFAPCRPVGFVEFADAL